MTGYIFAIILLFSHNVESDNRSFWATVKYGGQLEFCAESFTLYERSGKILYTKKNPPANTFFISNSGAVFAINEHHLYLFDKNGKEKLLKDLNYPNGFEFSTDNSLFFASDKDGVFAFSNNGELFYKFNPGRLFSSTARGEKIGIVSTDTLFLYGNGQFKSFKILLTPYVRDIYFSTDEKIIIVAEPSLIECFDFETGKKLEKR